GAAAADGTTPASGGPYAGNRRARGHHDRHPLRRHLPCPPQRPPRSWPPPPRRHQKRGFDSARLVAVSYSSPDYGGDGVVQLRRPRRARFNTSILRSFNAVSSRDGLLVLFRDEPGARL
ncbi:unnamed protein product, partial [Urochloa humidicola]